MPYIYATMWIITAITASIAVWVTKNAWPIMVMILPAIVMINLEAKR